jgi:CYTH domain-containing protein
MPGTDDDRYTRVEYERRFLVLPSADWQSLVEPYSKRLEDRYIRNSRLRLRMLTDSDTGRQIYKLNRKPGSDSPYFQTVGRILLSQEEYRLLEALEADCIQKVRYYHLHRGEVFSIDLFEGELEGLILCSVEVEGLEELMRIEPPGFVHREVTEDPFFTGGSLSRIRHRELIEKISMLA